MFEDWSRSLAQIDVETASDEAMRGWLAALARHRGALDAFEARVAGRLGTSSAVRGATRCTQREADRAVARGQLIEAVPAVGSALAAGEITGAHVDSLARAAERTSAEAVGSSDLLSTARSKPADAMQREVSDFVRRQASDADLEARFQRQRRNRRAFSAPPA